MTDTVTPKASEVTTAAQEAAPQWVPPSPWGNPAMVSAMGSVAAPLLAGFAVTFVTLTVQDPDKFRYPSLVLFAGTLAALALLTAVQCSFAAQRYTVTPAELTDFGLAGQAGIKREQWAYEYVRRAWSDRAIKAYNFGLIAFMVAIALLLAPKTGTAKGLVMPVVRWAAVVLACGGLTGEIGWWSLNKRAGQKWADTQTRQRVIDKVFPTVHGVLHALDHGAELKQR